MSVSDQTQPVIAPKAKEDPCPQCLQVGHDIHTCPVLSARVRFEAWLPISNFDRNINLTLKNIIMEGDKLGSLIRSREEERSELNDEDRRILNMKEIPRHHIWGAQLASLIEREAAAEEAANEKDAAEKAAEKAAAAANAAAEAAAAAAAAKAAEEEKAAAYEKFRATLQRQSKHRIIMMMFLCPYESESDRVLTEWLWKQTKDTVIDFFFMNDQEKSAYYTAHGPMHDSEAPEYTDEHAMEHQHDDYYWRDRELPSNVDYRRVSENRVE